LPDGGRREQAEGESKAERLNRELKELSDELRVALPGVQVLFAFLLTVPFTNRFEDVTDTQREAYFGAFLCATVASVCLIAPSVMHRIQWRRRDKERLLRTANRLALVGATFLALAITGAVFVVTDILFDSTWAAALACATAGLIAAVWFALPLYWRLTDNPDEYA
jgi:VIT1/CCC1 family predicted Fe2+/Mn2+ transporter